jgi:hypothetical protein
VLGSEEAGQVRHLTLVVLRQCRQLLLVGLVLGRLVGLQLFEPSLQYYTRTWLMVCVAKVDRV